MIIVGYIPDRYGRAALDHAIAEAKVRGTDLLVVNSTAGDALVDKRFAGEGEIESLEEHLAQAGVPHRIEQPVGTDPTDQLLDLMEDDAAELLVIGIRHRSAVGKLLLGSNAQRLLLNCPKPVLAVKPPIGD